MSPLPLPFSLFKGGTGRERSKLIVKAAAASAANACHASFFCWVAVVTDATLHFQEARWARLMASLHVLHRHLPLQQPAGLEHSLRSCANVHRVREYFFPACNSTENGLLGKCLPTCSTLWWYCPDFLLPIIRFIGKCSIIEETI